MPVRDALGHTIDGFVPSLRVMLDFAGSMTSRTTAVDVRNGLGFGDHCRLAVADDLTAA